MFTKFSFVTLTLLIFLAPLRASAHIAFWDPSAWGFNVSQQTFSYDNRPVVPLVYMNFTEWWFHNFLDYPPHEDDVFELPAGGIAMSQLACDKGATTWYESAPGGDIQDGNNPCPGSPIAEFHTTGIDDSAGCALAIAYKSNVSEVQPSDFAIFSVNTTCVWYRYTAFEVPAELPPCPDGKCICAWFWIHNIDSGSEQMYMNGFQCNVTGSTSTTPLAPAQLARRCGDDPANNKPADPSNCTIGPKQPHYWLQNEGNNMFEGYYSPPTYNQLYGYVDGAQPNLLVYPNSTGGESISFSGTYAVVGPTSNPPPPPPSSSSLASTSLTSTSTKPTVTTTSTFTKTTVVPSATQTQTCMKRRSAKRNVAKRSNPHIARRYDKRERSWWH